MGFLADNGFILLDNRGALNLSGSDWTWFGQYFGIITSGASLAVHQIALPLVNCPAGRSARTLAARERAGRKESPQMQKFPSTQPRLEGKGNVGILTYVCENKVWGLLIYH
jgi:hypothetical protein